ncbi:MAG: ATP phosphoribosyltransferase regulatory subunit [Rhodospirillales bacterium CG15_BIG_FIL_POST_REV_8_21_14_020_66_15]|nr:MAG: ATP phosphoribosyltransferase regulatory subunit [Rhodospirillales bacterium CG15_BIG_FIL_POST_REV_8_21_14_020_66_15]
MEDTSNPGLLPAGLSDLLPPDAGFEASVTERLIDLCQAHGYERVKPPLMEFEDSLLSGTGAAMERQVFRLMDPVSQRMMGLRADMTPQIARIAETRLKSSPRPLRLCYAGQVLRVRGDQIRPERQFAQIGAELIGSAAPAADAEVIVMAADALGYIGVADVSIDLALPTLVTAILGDAVAAPAERVLREALNHKDTGAIGDLSRQIGGGLTDLLKQLVLAAGPVDDTLAAVDAIDLPAAAAAEWRTLQTIVAKVRALAPGLTLTIDPVEHRGFEYHAGATFTLYAAGVRGELGSGGRYHAGNGGSTGANDRGGEPATGFTLFTDSLLRALPRPALGRRLFVPAATAPERMANLRAEGWITVAGLDDKAEAEAEARRLRCTHWLRDGRPAAVGET